MGISREKNVGKKLASLNINTESLSPKIQPNFHDFCSSENHSRYLNELWALQRIHRFTLTFALCKNSVVPNKGIASETWGRVSATRFRNTVSDSKMVTPETAVAHLCSMIRSRSSRLFASGVDEHLLSTRGRRDRRSTAARPFSLSFVDEEKSSGAEPRRVNSFHQ